MHTLGGADDVGADGDNDENLEALVEETSVVKKEVFPPIGLRLTAEEQKQLLRFDLQGRKNDYVKTFLQETWMRDDVFEAASRCRNTEQQKHKELLADLSGLNQDGNSISGRS